MSQQQSWLPGSLVLVTGATGRVGRRLSQELLAVGAKVRTVVLPGDPGRDLLDPKIEVVDGSLANRTTVTAALNGVDGLIHLAALMDWSPNANDSLFESNVQATYLLLDALAARAQRMQRVVLVSSDEVYPALSVDGMITEDLPLRPYSFYGLTKQMNEVLGTFYHRTAGLKVTTARFALTAAAEEITRHDGWSGRLFFASGLKALLRGLSRLDAVAAIDDATDRPERTLILALDADGVSYRNQFCDVRDLVRGILCLAVEPAAVGETFNLSGPAAFDYQDVVPRLAQAIGVPFVEVRLPGPRFNIETSVAKARQLVGFNPEFGINEIIDGLGEPSARPA